MARTIEQIKTEYADLCVKAGHIQYQIFTHTKDLELLNNTLRDLNFEAAKIQADSKPAETNLEEVKSV